MIPTLVEDNGAIIILDQTRLPHEVVTVRIDSLAGVMNAITAMQVRGAPLIGATAAFGVAIALAEGAEDANLKLICKLLAATRPTAVNLIWALNRMQAALMPLPVANRTASAWQVAREIAALDAQANAAIGQHGATFLTRLTHGLNRPLNVMTHCNAGRLATVAHGTALAPVYAAHAAGVPIHVWVSETRPRNQGLLTAWELNEARVPHTLIADNAAGHLIATGQVDVVIVGADRIAKNGDTANKIGTYLKALAAQASDIPFYVAAPLSTVDVACANGAAIPIEERNPIEVRSLQGLDKRGQLATINLCGDSVAVANPAFDVTPTHLITGIITERGVVAPERLRDLLE